MELAQHGLGCGAGDARVVCEAQLPGFFVVQIDHRAVAIQQARGLADGRLQELRIVLVAHR